jgi:hypothetical protein
MAPGPEGRVAFGEKGVHLLAGQHAVTVSVDALVAESLEKTGLLGLGDRRSRFILRQRRARHHQRCDDSQSGD